MPHVETSSVTAPPAPPSTLDSFVSNFHPALAGIQMLTMERIDRLRFRAVPTHRTVAIYLKSCRAALLSSSIDHFTFPAMMESVFNPVGGMSTIPLIVDSGASCCISPCRSDFGSDYSASDVKITDLSSTNSVKGKGLITWRVLDIHSKEVEIQLPGYHVPSALVRLLSPQCLLSVDSVGGGHATQDTSKYRFHLNNGIILDIPYGRANLPILLLSQGTDKKIANSNLSPAQKELLLWHHRLSHAGLSTIHNLLRVWRTAPVLSSVDLVPLCRGDLLPCKFKPPSSATDSLLCAACEIAKAKQHHPIIRSSGGNPMEQLSSLKAGHTNPCDCFSCDHYISPTPGRVVSHSSHSSTRHGFVGGTIWVDHASQWIFHSPQHSLNAADMIRGKLLLEREAADVGVVIKALHTDNGVFNSALFCGHCKDHNQGLRLAESALTIKMALLRMPSVLSAIWHKPISFMPLSAGQNDLSLTSGPSLCPTLSGYGLSPLELWSRVKSVHSDISRAHVFGCPVYVLDPSRQDGKKIPKWDSRARQGIFVGFLDKHSSLVPLVFNPRTQRVSPQYHIIFDDAFLTVPSLYSIEERNTRFEDVKSLGSTSAPRLLLTQAGLAKRIVDSLGLCSSFSMAISMPAEISPLPKDLSGTPPSGTFNYAAVVGMLLYLCGHTCPDIAFAVHQCARYTFCPTRRHELALIRIGRYLKCTMEKGIIMCLSDDPCVDCYPDADFAGLYGHEDSQDPHCARSHTGYLITVFNYPVLWKSKLQTEIALSTMEAECVALSTSCKDLFPIVDLILT
eukprot:CCRYP_014020-RA/>CCRYP_014020-RA protein AED:0.15 eAED:0.08 QI:0/0/0/0.75/0/0/4/0/791